MAALPGKVAVVGNAGVRGIACMLGEAGATVYCTGRSLRGQPSDKQRSETIEETAEMVTAYGGTGLWMQVDHTQQEQVKALFERRARARRAPGYPGERPHRRRLRRRVGFSNTRLDKGLACRGRRPFAHHQRLLRRAADAPQRRRTSSR